jgi:hypothetical protein
MDADERREAVMLVEGRLKRHSTPPRKRPKKPKTKLNINLARRLRAEGLSYRRIGKIFNMSGSGVYDILKRYEGDNMTLVEKIQQAVTKEDKINAIAAVINYYRDEDSSFWKPVVFDFNKVDLGDLEDVEHWLIGDIGELKSELNILESLDDMINR